MSTEATQRESSLCTDGSIAVPLGYKRTAVGTIPENWEVRTLGSLGQFKNGINKGKQDFGHGFPFVNLMDVFGVPKVSTDSSFGLVNSSLGEREAYALQSGDVLFVRSSVKPEGVGLTILIPEDLPNTVFSGFLIRYRENGVFALEFKEHCFWEAGFRNRLIASSTVSANTNINQEALKFLQLAFPPNKAEQRAIAEALSDVDGLLGALDALIAKKRAIKQAAMQQLLTGKTRMPGFSGEWVTKRIGDVAEVDPENLPSSTNQDFKFNYISIEQVHAGRLLSYTEETFRTAPSRARRVLRHGDVLMSTVRPNLMAHLLYLDQVPNAICSTGFAVLRSKHNLSVPDFLFAHLFSHDVNNQIEKILAGSNYPAISNRDVRMLEISCPLEVDEQRAIAATLSDMDAELTTLERRQHKTRAIKQGMIQQLLTGHVRLIKPTRTANDIAC